MRTPEGDGLAAEILGIHLEGPFISQARRGVHPADALAKPSVATLGKFIEAADGLVKIVTLAPELPGALELIAAAVAAKIVAAIGHTDADYDQARAAIHAGARHAVHMYNAMRPFSHRDPGVVGAILTDPEVTAEVIADRRSRGRAGDSGADRDEGIRHGSAGERRHRRHGHAGRQIPAGKFRGVRERWRRRNSEGKLAGSTLTLDRALRNIVGAWRAVARCGSHGHCASRAPAWPRRQKGHHRRRRGCRSRRADIRSARSRRNDARRRPRVAIYLRIQRDFQFFGEPMGIERAAGKKAACDFERGDFRRPLFTRRTNLFGAGRFVDIHFAKRDSAFAQEMLHAAAIAAPGGAVNCDQLHSLQVSPIVLIHSMRRKERGIQRGREMITVEGEASCALLVGSWRARQLADSLQSARARARRQASAPASPGFRRWPSPVPPAPAHERPSLAQRQFPRHARKSPPARSRGPAALPRIPESR